MKFYNLTLFMCFIFFNCASQKEHYSISKTIDLDSNDMYVVYYQSWVAGVQGGGSGLNLFIKDDLIDNPQKVYFRNKVVELEHKSDYYIGRFITETNQKKDYVIDSDRNKEYNNELPQKITFPFNLEQNEAVVLVLKEGGKEFIRIKNIAQKPVIAYPSVKK